MQVACSLVIAWLTLTKYLCLSLALTIVGVRSNVALRRNCVETYHRRIYHGSRQPSNHKIRTAMAYSIDAWIGIIMSAQAFIAFLRTEAQQAEERARALRATAAAIEANAYNGGGEFTIQAEIVCAATTSVVVWKHASNKEQVSCQWQKQRRLVLFYRTCLIPRCLPFTFDTASNSHFFLCLLLSPPTSSSTTMIRSQETQEQRSKQAKETSDCL